MEELTMEELETLDAPENEGMTFLYLSEDEPIAVEVVNFPEPVEADQISLADLYYRLDSGFMFLQFTLGILVGYLVSRDVVRSLIR